MNVRILQYIQIKWYSDFVLWRIEKLQVCIQALLRHYKINNWQWKAKIERYKVE